MIEYDKEWECTEGHRWLGNPFCMNITFEPQISSKGMCPYCFMIALENMVTSEIFERSGSRSKEN